MAKVSDKVAQRLKQHVGSLNPKEVVQHFNVDEKKEAAQKVNPFSKVAEKIKSVTVQKGNTPPVTVAKKEEVVAPVKGVKASDKLLSGLHSEYGKSARNGDGEGIKKIREKLKMLHSKMG